MKRRLFVVRVDVFAFAVDGDGHLMIGACSTTRIRYRAQKWHRSGTCTNRILRRLRREASDLLSDSCSAALLRQPLLPPAAAAAASY